MNNGEQIVNDRVGVYGPPAESFARVAQVWSGILGFEVHAWQVPLCQAGLKLVRADYAPDYSDNGDDVEGYIDIYRQVIGDDMVMASSVTEYLQEKEKRANPIVEMVVPQDQYVHGLPGEEGYRVCTWDTGLQQWHFYQEGGPYFLCQLSHS
jgi:hypothetical protein